MKDDSLPMLYILKTHPVVVAIHDLKYGTLHIIHCDHTKKRPS